ncbi:MAG: FHA domain-containing protein [Anaerolineales bacterium]|nr:FHA domain-containing protein [Anaerolineales bacterium]
MPDYVNDIPVLIAKTGKLRGQSWNLDKNELIIGRGSDSDIVITDRQVSRHHARIRRTPDGYVLYDLNSKNGTHLNGALVKAPTLLQDGDVIQVALALHLTYVGTESTVPLSMTDVLKKSEGRLRMVPQAHRVSIGEDEVEPPLSPPQYRLLELLYRNPDRVVSRDEVAEFVWPGTMGVGVSNQAIDALVRRVRGRLAEVDPDHAYLVTVRGHGFRLDNPP